MTPKTDPCKTVQRRRGTPAVTRVERPVSSARRAQAFAPPVRRTNALITAYCNVCSRRTFRQQCDRSAAIALLTKSSSAKKETRAQTMTSAAKANFSQAVRSLGGDRTACEKFAVARKDYKVKSAVALKISRSREARGGGSREGLCPPPWIQLPV